MSSGTGKRAPEKQGVAKSATCTFSAADNPVSNEAAGILLCPLKKKFQALQPYSAKAVHEQETEMALYKNMFIERSSEAIPSEIARSAKELSCYTRQQELDVLAGCSSLSVQNKQLRTTLFCDSREALSTRVAKRLGTACSEPYCHTATDSKDQRRKFRLD